MVWRNYAKRGRCKLWRRLYSVEGRSGGIAWRKSYAMRHRWISSWQSCGVSYGRPWADAGHDEAKLFFVHAGAREVRLVRDWMKSITGSWAYCKGIVLYRVGYKARR